VPNVHRKKICPTCKIEHRHRGNYCSQGCANSLRVITDTTKRKISKKKREWHLNPEAIVASRNFAAGTSITIDEFMIEIPTVHDDDEIPEGFDRAEDW